tara:strand:- start:470 stop:769 length:300 start_codon:yes stop_codon:yes gene_type:complete
MFEKIKNNYLLIITLLLIIYFIFNLFDGERGMISFFKKKQLLSSLETKEQNIIEEIKKLEFKNYLLTNEINIDFIETLIRDKFIIGKSGEKIYIVTDEN